MALPIKYQGIGLSILLGIGALVVYMLMMPEVNEPLLPAITICAAIYLFFGAVAGFIWRDGNWQWGFWIVAPFWLLTGFSMLFAGIYTPKFFTSDIPILVTTVIAACLGAYIGVSLRNRISSPVSTIS